MSDTGIDIVFRIINGGVLVGFGYYFFHKKCWLFIHQLYTDKQKFLGGLKEQVASLEYQKELVKHDVKEQEQQIRVLAQRMVLWKKRVEQEMQDRKEFLQNQKEQIYQRIRQRQHLIAQQNTYAYIAQESIKQVSDIVRETYQSDSAGDTVISSMITSLAKKIS